VVLALLLMSTGTSAQTTHTVLQLNFDFSPNDLTIDVGDTVDFVWTSETHTVTEGLGPIPTGGEAFDQLINPANQLFSLTFDTKFLFEFPRVDDRYDYYCIPHFSFGQLGVVRVISPWANDGFALSGVTGDPLLYGNGTLDAGTTAEVVLENAAPNALVGLFISFASIPTPFKGGTLCTIPLDSLTLFPIGPSGGVVLADTIPAGIPSGLEMFWQYAIQDAAAVKGVAMSNCLRSTFP
jgi:plastocyanin